MSGSGMIAARPEGLVVDDSDAPATDVFNRAMAVVAEACRHNHALGIIMLAAAKCTDVQKLADSGRIDREGADLFIRRYSESIAEIVAELVPPASSSKVN